MHLLIGRPREDLSDDEQRELDAAVHRLTTVPSVHRMTWGHDFSGRGKGYTIAGVIEFQTRDDLQAYLDDPGHRAVVEVFNRLMPDRLILDYETDSSGISA